MAKRVTITMREDVYVFLRKEQAKVLKTGVSCSFSKIVNIKLGEALK